MLDMFIYEMSQLLEQLEQTIIESESDYSMDQINEIFRIMHTIKGSAAMMMYNSMSTTAHSVEDLFYYLREENPKGVDYSRLTDLVLEGMDFVKAELTKIQLGEEPNGDGSDIISRIKSFLAEIKGEKPKVEAKKSEAKKADEPKAAVNDKINGEGTDNGEAKTYSAKVFFEDGCEMENVRSYTIIHNLKPIAIEISHIPEDIIDEESIEVIRANGFSIEIKTEKTYEELQKLLLDTVFLRELVLNEVTQVPQEDTKEVEKEVQKEETKAVAAAQAPTDVQHHDGADQQGQNKKQVTQHMISVNVSKLDQLLNLMGELVIAEAMTTENPELEGLALESFHKAARQLRKIINDVQDTVMSMRMVPLSTTFFKMNRIVRDMCKELNKEVQLEIIGENTEVDKNIIEHISDPIMHMIRNSVDHGIENPEERIKNGKEEKGLVILEAKNSGSDVLIIIKDDGEGINKERVMEKAKNNGLLRKPESEYTEKEIHQFIFLPGFSTNEQVTGYSGRGVGMDVVTTNIEAVGGSILVESEEGAGSTFTLKIPLTLAIIEGMTIKLGGAKYTIPIISIKESFKPKKESVFNDPDGNEMITVRGECYNVIKLNEFFGVETNIENIEDGIMIMLENGDQTVCLLVDELIGEQQVVVKSMPKYIRKIRGLSGCTLLGNGDISLIIDVAGFFDK